MKLGLAVLLGNHHPLAEGPGVAGCHQGLSPEELDPIDPLAPPRLDHCLILAEEVGEMVHFMQSCFDMYLTEQVREEEHATADAPAPPEFLSSTLTVREVEDCPGRPGVKLVTAALDVFNNVVQYQYEGNAQLVYALCRKAPVIRGLASMTYSGSDDAGPGYTSGT